MKDSLGDRMKEQYEDRASYSLPRRSYTIVRLDGKAFHTFTKGMDKPFCKTLIQSMVYAAGEVCRQADGAQFAYLQSDEASILLTDFAKPDTNAWFNGNVQKIASVSASIMTAAFNNYFPGRKLALFDARAFSIPDDVEVENYFVWRQKDWIRNSLQMLSRSHFSHNKLHGKKVHDMHQMLHNKGVNWAQLDQGLKNGHLVRYVTGTGWVAEEAFTFTGAERAKLTALIPKRWAEPEEE
jgi:tRNA(His) guanylyltransferase